MRWLSLSSFLATAVARRADIKEHVSSLPNCLEKSSFARVTDVGVVGQCLPASSPGAYYTKNAKDGWQCWNVDTDDSIRTDDEAKNQGFEGACLFPASSKKPDDVKVCGNSGFEDCVTQDDEYWGACYTDGEKPLCIPNSDAVQIQGFSNGNCLGQGVRDKQDDLYKDVCRLVKVEMPMYKCDTIQPTYNPADATVCMNKGEGNADFSACFSTVKSVNWQCHSTKKDSRSPHFCANSPYGPEPTKKYDGACLFKGADGYDEAAVFKPPPSTPPPTPPSTPPPPTPTPPPSEAAPAPSPPSNPQPAGAVFGAGVSLSVVLIALVTMFLA